MNIAYMEAFLYAVYTNSIQQAADKLFLAQPTVSARIKALERELDTNLFARQGRGIVLTEDGRNFVPYAEQIIQTYARAKKSLRPSSEKIMKIGAHFEASDYFIPFALPLFKKTYSHVQLKFISGYKEELVDQLLCNKMQIALLPNVSHPSLRQHLLFNNSLQLVTGIGHPFANRQVIDLDELEKQPFVVVEPALASWNELKYTVEQEGIEVDAPFVVNHFQIAKTLIQNNHAIGFLPKMNVAKELQLGHLRTVKVSFDLPLTQSIYATYYGAEIPLLWEAIIETAEQFKQYDWTKKYQRSLMHV